MVNVTVSDAAVPSMSSTHSTTVFFATGRQPSSHSFVLPEMKIILATVAVAQRHYLPAELREAVVAKICVATQARPERHDSGEPGRHRLTVDVARHHAVGQQS